MAENQISKNEKILASLSYCWIFCLVPLFFEKKFRIPGNANTGSAFVRFHAKQGLILLVVWLVVSLLSWIPFIGQLAVFVLIVFSILGFIKTIKGEEWEMPLIGRYARQIKI
jgi:uncharacterized membrane protein